MKRIIDELARVCGLLRCFGDEVMVSRKYKDDREWWVLGCMVLIFNEQGLECAEFADKEEAPDFKTYDKTKERFKPVEVTTAFRPGRKLGDEYKSDKSSQSSEFKRVQQVEEPWSTIAACLKKKFAKTYPSDCWLVIYHNMLYSEVSPYGWWHSTLLSVARSWYASDELNRVNLNTSPFERILVVNSAGTAMVNIFPELTVIAPVPGGRYRGRNR